MKKFFSWFIGLFSRGGDGRQPKPAKEKGTLSTAKVSQAVGAHDPDRYYTAVGQPKGTHFTPQQAHHKPQNCSECGKPATMRLVAGDTLLYSCDNSKCKESAANKRTAALVA